MDRPSVRNSQQTWRGHWRSLVAEPFKSEALGFFPPQAGLDVTLGEVLCDPFYVNNTRITRLCLPAGRQGSVSGRAVYATTR